MITTFYKYQGTGNDFVILDNRDGRYDNLQTQQIQHLCNRRFGIGGDGLMCLNLVNNYDFEMKYYNADGKESSMCGNGGRCLTQFAYDRGMKQESYEFIAIDGPHEANFAENEWVRLKMKNVDGIKSYSDDYVLDTGSPHYVKSTINLKSLDVTNEGRKIRCSDNFKTAGINVNFVEQLDNKIFVRTYERGVEEETLSCGTGVTACALVAGKNKGGFNRVDVQTLGGQLAVEFNNTSDNTFENIWLCGPATFVFKGEIEL